MHKWVAIKERESQQWIISGLTDGYYEGAGKKKRYVRKSWVFPKPEHVSPFIEKHKIIEANTKEEAQWLISNLK